MMNMKTIFVVLAIFAGVLTVFCLPSAVLAQEFGLELEEELHPHEAGVSETPKLEFPEIEPEVTLGGGYKIFSSKDSKRTPRNEYVDLQDTPIYLLSTKVFRYPDRFTMDLMFESKPKDHFADIGYGYRDLILARGINRAMYHNLDNLRILSATPSGTDVLQLDSPSKEYGLRTMISAAQIRLKAPNYPAHFFVDYDQVQKNGDRQQRYLAGTSYHSGNWVSSESRDVDFMTNDYGFGLNSHLGPVEAEYTFHTKEFDDGSGDDAMFALQTAAYPQGGIYPAGTWPHNVYAGLREYRHNLKLHTMYTGKLVASVTLSKTGQENNYSDAERDILSGGGSVTFMPVTALTFTAKYRYRDVDNDTPVSVVIQSQEGATSRLVTPRESMDSTTNTIDLGARYRALSWLTLRGGYTYERQERNHTEDWGHLQDASRKQVWSVQADTRLGKMLRSSAEYQNIRTKHPAYNVEPDQAHDAKVSFTFTPIEFLTAFASYNYRLEDRDDLHWLEEPYQPDSPIADERSVKKHNVTSNITLMLTKRVSLTANYAYFQNHTQQDLVHTVSNPPVGASGDYQTDPGTWWRTWSHVYGAGINMEPLKTVHFDAGITFIKTKAKLDWDWREVVPDPMEIGSLSNVRTDEMIIHAGTRIRLPDNFGLGLNYQFSRFDDRANNGFTDMDDGNAHLVLLTFTKTLGKGT